MEGHFDYGNGFHGKLYLNPHQLFQYPSTIWRVAQDLIDVMPADFIDKTQIVAGPATGGALLAHTMAGLLDGRRPMTHPPYLFAPFGDRRRPADAQPVLRAAHERQARADRGRCAQHRHDVQAMRRPRRGRRRHGRSARCRSSIAARRASASTCRTWRWWNTRRRRTTRRRRARCARPACRSPPSDSR